MTRQVIAFFIAGLALLSAAPASAFCGFYVSGADAKLYNNATMATLMRHGERTVLSMQNNYEGPAEDFAMVVPVPMVLHKENVRTLPDGVFDNLDQVTAPRLVEYHERNPCPSSGDAKAAAAEVVSKSVTSPARAAASANTGTVTVEAEFKVGEYEIVVLSSNESTALESWLTEHGYNIPDGAAPFFTPYIQKGQYFFVAKVDIDEVEYRDGEAVLSPLRFHYDARNFVLPVRLGLINSKGSQDLIAFVIARDQRYEVANLPNVSIPTNIAVEPNTRDQFGSFYQQLFNTVMAENPGAVVTEYAWTLLGSGVRKCDPCTAPQPDAQAMLTLGGDVLGDPGSEVRKSFGSGDWVITRLHTRYNEDSLGDDLVFRKAPPIKGGRGMPTGVDGELGQQFAVESEFNNFQARYVIRHFWDGDANCAMPDFGDWTGSRWGRQPRAARNLGFDSASPTRSLGSFVTGQSRLPGLDRDVDAYDEPIANVLSKSRGAEAVKAPAKSSTGGVLDATKDLEHTSWDEVDRGWAATCAGMVPGGVIGGVIVGVFASLVGIFAVRRWRAG